MKDAREARPGGRGGRGHARVAALGGVCALGLTALGDGGHRAHGVLVMSALVAHVFVLTAGGLVYWRWRSGETLRPDSAAERQLSGWLSVGLLVTGMQGLAMTAPHIDGTWTAQRWLLVDEVVVLVVLCAATALTNRVPVPGDPAVVGLAIGLALAALSVVPQAAGLPALPGGLVAPLGAVALLLALLLAHLVLTRTHAQAWVRRRMAFSSLALAAAGIVLGAGPSHVGLVLAAAGADVVGAVVICLTMQTMLRTVLAEHRAQVVSLQAALQDYDRGLAGHRELLHELSSTITGIATASQLRGRLEVPLERRQRLESMVEAELARLQRLVSPLGSWPVGDELDVDEVVGTLAISHQTRGRLVLWEPCGLRARGDADDLAEVVNVLLENAARHAPGSRVKLETRAVGAGIEIWCRDDGPGIPPELVDRVFESDVRSPTSGGQGLGLAIARRRMRDLDGEIELAETGAGGTVFVLRLQGIGVTRDLDVVA